MRTHMVHSLLMMHISDLSDIYQIGHVTEIEVSKKWHFVYTQKSLFFGPSKMVLRVPNRGPIWQIQPICLILVPFGKCRSHHDPSRFEHAGPHRPVNYTRLTADRGVTGVRVRVLCVRWSLRARSKLRKSRFRGKSRKNHRSGGKTDHSEKPKKFTFYS